MKKLDLKAMVTCAALIAAAIVLSRFSSINVWNLKIGFTFVPVFIAAYLYGPIGGAVVGGIADFIGAILFPIGAYFPGFTLTCVITGAVYGLLLHKKQTPLRILDRDRDRAAWLRTSGKHLLDLRPVRLTVYGTFGDTQCAVFDHDSGRVYRHRCDEPPACAA